MCDGGENCNSCRTDCGVCSGNGGGSSGGGGPSIIPTPKNRIIEPVSGNAPNPIPTVQDTHTVITNEVPTFIGISTPPKMEKQEQPRNISSVIPQIVSSVVTLAVLTVAVVRLNLKKKQRVKAGYSQQYLEALKLREYQMFEWVQQAKSKGYSNENIMQMLTNNGWTQPMIKDALRYRQDPFNEKDSIAYLKSLVP